MKNSKISFNGNIFLHLGFPKTGTMAIQNEIFPHLKEIEYFGMSRTIKSSGSYKDFTNYIYPNSKIELNNLRQTFAGFESIGVKNVLLSHVYPTNPKNLIKISDYEMFFELVSETFEDYRVIFTIRRPSDLLQSLYLHENQGLDTNEFDQWLRSKRIQHFFKFLKFSSIELVCKNAHIPYLLLPQEKLLSNRQAYVNEITHFLGVDEVDVSEMIDDKPHLRHSDVLKRIRLSYKKLPKKLRFYSSLPASVQSSIFRLLDYGKRQTVFVCPQTKQLMSELDKSYECFL